MSSPPLAARVHDRLYPLYGRTLADPVRQLFTMELVKRTGNFGNLLWDGVTIWQNPLDLWIITQTIQEVRPTLIIETGTYLGGSALYLAAQLDHLGEGRIITMDVEDRHQGSHPRVEYLVGSSIDDERVARVRAAAARADGPVLVILDSDHRAEHVLMEMEAYAPTVTPGSYMLVQDGIIDTLPTMDGVPGPLRAIDHFLSQHSEFEVDEERCNRFLVTSHPKGWLRRK